MAGFHLSIYGRFWVSTEVSGADQVHGDWITEATMRRWWMKHLDQ
jgi:hypothetical protein